MSVAFTDGNAVEASVKDLMKRDLAVVSVSLDDIKMIQWMPFQLRRLAVLMI